PVTGTPIAPLPFLDITIGLADAVPNQPLPTLDLSRVFLITGPRTCSASESIVNSLRGVGVEVVQIGARTCGKPYGFYPQDNCGTTYFSIQFRGVNDAGFGDYADGFAPAGTAALSATDLPGCAVPDDFDHQLGDSHEARLAAALQYRDGGSCPLVLAGAALPDSSLRAVPETATGQLAIAIADKSPWRTNRILTPW
ncbi:MAG TPA: peptidase, partial [Gammaproteobacteria bacterium]|nr:peptidase [Gammaproteobacteria bacterium]